MTLRNEENFDLDNVFSEVGEFGLFQIYAFLLLSTMKVLSGLSVTNFMISANTLDYRCLIPECDVGNNPRDIQYEQPWLEYAIPHSDGKIESCYRFAARNGTFRGQCSADMFDTSVKIACTSFVYASDERNVQTEFNIHCDESYKLALVGTIGNVGRFIFLPISGILSDKFGRLPGIIIGTGLSNLFSVIKSFSVDYYMYVIFEFLEACANACAFSGMFVLAVELVNAKYRVFGSAMISIASPIGGMLLGLVAMYVHDFRTSIRILHTPGLFVFIYFWLLPESVRWLLVTGRVDRAINNLKRIAKVNRKKLSPKTIEIITQHYTTETVAKKKSIEAAENKGKKSDSVFQSVRSMMKSRTLMVRFLICSYQWIACTFSYYGLSLSATHIPGANRYISFIIVMGIEIPGSLLSQPLLIRMKRRYIMSITMLLSAILISSIPLIPKEYPMIVLFCFVVGKAAITFAFTVLYVYTAEQWPTNVRSTAHNTCSMIGRVGAMIAPLTLTGQNNSLPNFLFDGTAFLSVVLGVLGPETYMKKLPDTIDEAENL